jgi:hypothetical protein
MHPGQVLSPENFAAVYAELLAQKNSSPQPKASCAPVAPTPQKQGLRPGQYTAQNAPVILIQAEIDFEKIRQDDEPVGYDDKNDLEDLI